MPFPALNIKTIPIFLPTITFIFAILIHLLNKFAKILNICLNYYLQLMVFILLVLLCFYVLTICSYVQYIYTNFTFLLPSFPIF